MSKVIIENLSDSIISEKKIKSWPIWTKEISRFEWTYDEAEECYFIEGEVVIETKEGNFNIKPGDFVTFRKGLNCIWDIKKPVKKHYNFEN